MQFAVSARPGRPWHTHARPWHTHARPGFTLVELLVVITIIGILATVVMGGLNLARESAREAKTKATIAKINEVLMLKYDSYLTRRVPVNTMGMPPGTAATHRLQAIRKLMAMEMPDRFGDFNTVTAASPVSYGSGSMPASALAVFYAQKYNASTPKPLTTHAKFGSMESAQCLYMLVTMGSPESRELFNANEYADFSLDANNRYWPVFVDGWGQPIKFLREPRAFTIAAGLSDIQSGDAAKDHDPFDPLNLEQTAYQLTPLIYSSGKDKLYGINEAAGASCGTPQAEGGKSNVHFDNIHNHSIKAN